MFKPNEKLNEPIKATALDIKNIATPMYANSTNIVPITLYDENKQPVAVKNLVIPIEGLYAVLYNDKIYILRNGIFIETNIIKVA